MAKCFQYKLIRLVLNCQRCSVFEFFVLNLILADHFVLNNEKNIAASSGHQTLDLLCSVQRLYSPSVLDS